MTVLNRFRCVMAILSVLVIFPAYANTVAKSAPVTTTPNSQTLPLQQSITKTNKTKQSSKSELPITVLNQMTAAIAQKNYKLVFINGSNLGFETMIYYHGVLNNEPISQLIYMEGPARVIAQKGDSVSYSEENRQSYSLHSQHIVDGLPAIFHADFNQLTQYYDFSFAGYGRTANKNCILIRMLDKQHDRYTQLMWIDTETYLPLRIDYIDQTGQVVEQFKVAQEQLYSTLPAVLQKVNSASVPPLLAVNQKSNISTDWQLTWLPEGMTKRACFVDSTTGSASKEDASVIDSCYFSDGIYSFTINTSIDTQQNESVQNLIKGIRLIHIEYEDGHEVVFIGNLPINTAEKVINGLEFSH